MKQIILYLLILPLCLSAQTQQGFFGIIEGAGNCVFFDWDAHDHRREWHSVEYGTETGITKTFPGENTRKSEVHRSRIRYLADMPQLERQPQSTDNRQLYANDTLCVEIRLQDFQLSEHVIVKDSLTGFVRSIDGCSELIGTDGNLPQREYASVILCILAEIFSQLVGKADIRGCQDSGLCIKAANTVVLVRVSLGVAASLALFGYYMYQHRLLHGQGKRINGQETALGIHPRREHTQEEKRQQASQMFLHKVSSFPLYKLLKISSWISVRMSMSPNFVFHTLGQRRLLRKTYTVRLAGSTHAQVPVKPVCP